MNQANIMGMFHEESWVDTNKDRVVLVFNAILGIEPDWCIKETTESISLHDQNDSAIFLFLKSSQKVGTIRNSFFVTYNIIEAIANTRGLNFWSINNQIRIAENEYIKHSKIVEVPGTDHPAKLQFRMLLLFGVGKGNNLLNPPLELP